MTNYMNIYLNYLKGEKKSINTVTAYKTDIEQCLKYIGKPVEDIKYSDLLDWKGVISELSSASVNRKIVAVRGYFQLLEDVEIIESNPAIKLKSVKAESKERDYIPMDEAVKMLDVCKNKRERALISLMLSTGLRISEVINMTLLDYQQDRIVLVTKGNKERVIYLNTDCRRRIDEYITVRKEGIDNLFVSNHGTKMNNICVGKMLKRVAKDSGIEKNISSHSMRHSFVSNVADKYGVDIACKAVGHSNVQTTMGYRHVKESVIQDVMMSISL